MSNVEVVILIALLLIFGGVSPIWPHSATWGYYPGGITLVLILIVLIIAMARRP